VAQQNPSTEAKITAYQQAEEETSQRGPREELRCGGGGGVAGGGRRDPAETRSGPAAPVLAATQPDDLGHYLPAPLPPPTRRPRGSAPESTVASMRVVGRCGCRIRTAFWMV
jgi:hypothetical protein